MQFKGSFLYLCTKQSGLTYNDELITAYSSKRGRVTVIGKRLDCFQIGPASFI